MNPEASSSTVDASTVSIESDPDPDPEPDSDPDPKLPFAALYARRYGQPTRNQWQQAWTHCIEQWLGSGARRSDHTRRAYQRNLKTFQQYIAQQNNIHHLWQVTPMQVNGWIVEMCNEQLSESTINQRLATLSSLYKFASNTTTIIGGREISLLIDAYGNTRISPFTSTNIKRPKIRPYSNALALPADAYSWVIYDLQQRTPTVSNLRNLALLLMFGLNGWRANEVLSMQWHYIHQGGKDQYIYEWTGKGSNGERTKRSLPATNYSAIINYLSVAGRYHPHAINHPDHIQGDAYIWQPVANIKRNNFKHTPKTLDANRPISRSSATGVLQRHLNRYYRQLYRQLGRPDANEAARKEAKKYTLHSLRHMVAQQLYLGSKSDLKQVQALMNHKSIATTQIYLDNLATPNDAHSHILSQQLSLNFPKA